MKTTAVLVISFWALAACLAACGSGGRGDDDANAPDIDVTAEQEQAMCDLLNTDVGTTPATANAGADMESAPGINAQPGKKPIHLTDFEGQKGGYLRLTIDPALSSPVLLMFEDVMPFQVVREDGEAVDLHDAAESSELCPAAGGRYTWFVSGSTNYLVFGPTDNVNFDLVLETVD